MGSFKKFLNEQEDLLKEINAILDDMCESDLDDFGYALYFEFFEDEPGEEDDLALFERSDVDEMISILGPDMYEFILDLLEEMPVSDDEDDQEDEFDSGNDDMEDSDGDGDVSEGVGRRMIQKNMNRKKRKFMKNSKAMMRRTKAARKKLARKNRAKKKRYYRANKVKIAAYQKSRAAAIKKGKHKVKLRRAAG